MTNFSWDDVIGHPASRGTCGEVELILCSDCGKATPWNYRNISRSRTITFTDSMIRFWKCAKFKFEALQDPRIIGFKINWFSETLHLTYYIYFWPRINRFNQKIQTQFCLSLYSSAVLVIITIKSNCLPLCYSEPTKHNLGLWRWFLIGTDKYMNYMINWRMTFPDIRNNMGINRFPHCLLIGTAVSSIRKLNHEYKVFLYLFKRNDFRKLKRFARKYISFEILTHSI